MSTFRFLVYWSTLEFDANNSYWEVLAVFLMGLRFDILILGFIGFPFVAVGLVCLIVGRWPLRDQQWLQKYLVSFWILFSILSFFDLDFFLYQHRHMQLADHLAFEHFDFLVNSFQVTSVETLALSLLIWLCVCWITARVLLRKSMKVFRDDLVPAPLTRLTFWKWLVPVCIVVLMARGTIMAHHLELAHSDVTQNPRLNEIVLNPAWTLDKNYTRN